MFYWIRFLPPTSAVEVIETERLVCVGVRTITTELCDIQTRKFKCRSTWTISRSSFMVKVIGQMPWSPGGKMWFPGNSPDLCLIWKTWYNCLDYGVMSGGQSLTSRYHVTSQKDLGKRTLKMREVYERLGVFITSMMKSSLFLLIYIDSPWSSDDF